MPPHNVCAFHTGRIYKERSLVSSVFTVTFATRRTKHTNTGAFGYTLYNHTEHKSLKSNCDKIRKDLSSYRVLFLVITPFPKFGQRTYLKFWLCPLSQMPSWSAKFLQTVLSLLQRFLFSLKQHSGKEFHSHSSKGCQFPGAQMTSWHISAKGFLK